MDEAEHVTGWQTLFPVNRRWLTEAAELADDVGQGHVGHALQLILDAPGQCRVAQVPGLDVPLYQRHSGSRRGQRDLGKR